MTASFQLTVDDHRELHGLAVRTLRRSIPGIMVMSGPVLYLAGYVILFTVGGGGYAGLGVFAAIWFAIAFRLYLPGTNKAGRLQILSQTQTDIPTTFSITDDGVRVAQEGNRQSYEWGTLTRFNESGGLFILDFDMSTVVLPKRSLGGLAQIEELRKLLLHKAPAAGKRVERP